MYVYVFTGLEQWIIWSSDAASGSGERTLHAHVFTAEEQRNSTEIKVQLLDQVKNLNHFFVATASRVQLNKVL